LRGFCARNEETIKICGWGIDGGKLFMDKSEVKSSEPEIS
jgi:hypothetical protein